MATQLEVSQAIVSSIAAVVYPGGPSQPPVTPYNVRVFPGWPIPEQQAKDFAAQIAQISVFPTRVGKQLPALPDFTDGPLSNHKAIRTTALRREQRQWQITVWAWCFDAREPIAKAVDVALETANRLTFADGSVGNIWYVNSYQDDGDQKQGIYRYDLFYMVDYALTKQEELDEVQATEVHYSGGPTFDVQGPVVTVTQP